MARSLNKVTLIGNVGVNPEIRYTQNGSVIATLSLATSSVWKDKNTGQQQEKTEWHRITIFNKLAEIVQNLVKKGSKLYVEGKLQTRKWQDQKGEDRYTTEIVVDYGGQLLLLDSRPDNHSNSNHASYNNSNNGYYMGDKKQANNSSQGNNYYHNNNNTQFKQADVKPEDNMHNRGNNSLQMPTMPLSSSPEKSATTDDSYKQQATQFDRFEDEIPF
jgi:single-strand DNA-binding protein